ncbi:sensor domain-containing diguanylate cyclase [Candidimonas sp. SYP-B2681]|uniref:sensor domain-containing protein n=1 Tax=Candidimonas sp. SYP-B2681 TaxID=2497686 RepID=UPI000F876458|nr:diguanylate cyclase [Candidimonas sp. SYP-B2681]RTZ40626.1 sensor domain-containing diguanylate cyclase [Candidimonas sp. SYP-B2681]
MSSKLSIETKFQTPLASFIDLIVDAVFAVDVNANVVFASAACERIFGYTPQEMVGRNMFDMMLPEDRDKTRHSVVDIMAGQLQLNFENRYIRKDGLVVHIMWSTQWSPADQLRIGVARDVTNRKRAESMQAALYSISEAAYAAEDLLTLFQRIHQIVGTLLRVDNFSVTLYDAETGTLNSPYHVDEYLQAPEVSRPAAGTLCAEIIRTGLPLLLTADAVLARLEETQVLTGPNPLCWLGVPLKSHKDTIGVLTVKSYPGGISYTEEDQELLQFVSTQIATVIERLQWQVRLRNMAQYDQLTTLPNRGFLYDRLKMALASAKRDQGRLSVLYIDLDKFKQVNDRLGHGVGDLLLQEVAKRLKQCVRDSDTVARVGGDEFVVLLQSIAMPQHATMVAEKIRRIVSAPLLLDGHKLNIVPSVGIALYPEDGNTDDQLLQHADRAMYVKKNTDHG